MVKGWLPRVVYIGISLRFHLNSVFLLRHEYNTNVNSIFTLMFMISFTQLIFLKSYNNKTIHQYRIHHTRISVKRGLFDIQLSNGSSHHSEPYIKFVKCNQQHDHDARFYNVDCISMLCIKCFIVVLCLFHSNIICVKHIIIVI